MTKPMSRKRLEYAAESFLGEMAKQFVAANPEAEHRPPRTLDAYPEKQRSSLMRAIGVALKSTKADSDQAFQAWMDRQRAESGV